MESGINVVGANPDEFSVASIVSIASYVNDNTIYQSGNNVDDVINGLKSQQKNLSNALLIIM